MHCAHAIQAEEGELANYRDLLISLNDSSFLSL